MQYIFYEIISYTVHKSNRIVIDLKIVISYLKRFNWVKYRHSEQPLARVELNIAAADCDGILCKCAHAGCPNQTSWVAPGPRELACSLPYTGKG